MLTADSITLNPSRMPGGGGGGWKFRPKIKFIGTIFSLKIGILLGKYFRKQTNS